MVPADVENAVAAQEIEIRNIVHVVEIGAFSPGIHLVETDDTLGCNQGPVQMPLVQVVVLAQARRDDLFQIKSHAPTFCDLRSKRKRSAALRFPILISLVSAHLQIGLAW